MHQIKIFKSVETEVRGLEQDVNDWLRASGARVLSITGNIAPQSDQMGPPGSGNTGSFRYAPSDVLVIVLYETA